MVVHKTSHSLSMSYLTIICMVGILWIGGTLVELANQNSLVHTRITQLLNSASIRAIMRFTKLSPPNFFFMLNLP